MEVVVVMTMIMVIFYASKTSNPLKFLFNFSILPKFFLCKPCLSADKQERRYNLDRVTHLNNDTKHNDKPTETK